ncbi:Response regulator [Candidatus Magnetomoraceae bacterium gMMP-15]
MNPYYILIVDDDPVIIKSVGNALENLNYYVVTAENGKKAVEKLNKQYFDIVITKLNIDGIMILKKAKEIDAKIKVIILSSYTDMKSVIKAIRLDADDYILKPFEMEELIFRLDRCIKKLELQRKIKLYEKILPICCKCKKIRDDKGKELIDKGRKNSHDKSKAHGIWMSVNTYLEIKTDLSASSTLCPECFKRVTEELEEALRNSPGDSTILEKLGDVYIKMNKTKEALKFYKMRSEK